jgi:hypothetical protein
LVAIFHFNETITEVLEMYYIEEVFHLVAVHGSDVCGEEKVIEDEEICVEDSMCHKKMEIH